MHVRRVRRVEQVVEPNSLPECPECFPVDASIIILRFVVGDTHEACAIFYHVCHHAKYETVGNITKWTETPKHLFEYEESLCCVHRHIRAVSNYWCEWPRNLLSCVQDCAFESIVGIGVRQRGRDIQVRAVDWVGNVVDIGEAFITSLVHLELIFHANAVHRGIQVLKKCCFREFVLYTLNYVLLLRFLVLCSDHARCRWKNK